MKKNIFFTMFLLVIGSFCFAQQNFENEIRELENAQREAFLKKDTAKLFKLLSPDFVVNAPTNKITTLAELKKVMRLGYVDLDSFERFIEKITFIKNIAVVMGYDVVYPSGKMPDAGKKVKRRYTNIWMKTNDNWQLVARQATILSVD